MLSRYEGNPDQGSCDTCIEELEPPDLYSMVITFLVVSSKVELSFSLSSSSSSSSLSAAVLSSLTEIYSMRQKKLPMNGPSVLCERCVNGGRTWRERDLNGT